ncbi:MAG: hypothetical protein KDA25_12220, partial [Phycisphaerales bacterium]|nr:hypothetical protein [Phycisphaerales bacterium]
REIATALRTATTTDSIDEIVESVGIARGRRAAAHIESWTTNAERLVAPGDVATFRESMRPIGHVCDGFERASWQVVRPARETLRIEAILHLSPPDSARRAADPIRPPLP